MSYIAKVGLRKPQRRQRLGLMQVLSDDHPLVKYGSCDKTPEHGRFRAPLDGFALNVQAWVNSYHSLPRNAVLAKAADEQAKVYDWEGGSG